MRSFVSFWKCTGRGITCLFQFCIPSFTAPIRKLMAALHLRVSGSLLPSADFHQDECGSRNFQVQFLLREPLAVALAAKLTTRRGEIESKKWAYWVVLALAGAQPAAFPSHTHTRSPLYFSLDAALAPFPWEMTLCGVTTSQPERGGGGKVRAAWMAFLGPLLEWYYLNLLLWAQRCRRST